MREIGPARRDFLIQFPSCWLCVVRPSDCVHEMARGGNRNLALTNRCTWFASCSQCNLGPLNDWGKVPLFVQLAIKWMFDRDGFDLQKFEEIYGNHVMVKWEQNG